MAKTTTKKSTASSALKGLGPGACSSALKDLAAKGAPVQVVGRFRNGKLEIDQASLEQATKRFPNANWAFIAANAPFDPTPHA
jgi:hypothetical protein